MHNYKLTFAVLAILGAFFLASCIQPKKLVDKAVDTASQYNKPNNPFRGMFAPKDKETPLGKQILGKMMWALGAATVVFGLIAAFFKKPPVTAGICFAGLMVAACMHQFYAQLMWVLALIIFSLIAFLAFGAFKYLKLTKGFKGVVASVTHAFASVPDDTKAEFKKRLGDHQDDETQEQVLIHKAQAKKDEAKAKKDKPKVDTA